MPFKSEKQRRFMHMEHPEIADRWERKHAKKHSKRALQAAMRARRKGK